MSDVCPAVQREGETNAVGRVCETTELLPLLPSTPVK